MFQKTVAFFGNFGIERIFTLVVCRERRFEHGVAGMTTTTIRTT